MLEFTDRYKALGLPYPDPATMCEDQCEGTGRVPIHASEMDEPWRTLWQQAPDVSPDADGWKFVVCPSCQGTGTRR